MLSHDINAINSQIMVNGRLRHFIYLYLRVGEEGGFGVFHSGGFWFAFIVHVCLFFCLFLFMFVLWESGKSFIGDGSEYEFSS